MLPKPGSRAHQLVEQLGLSPHPERGFFVETYRAADVVVSSTRRGQRAASTAIYFLITREQPCTHLHRLVSDEVFHLYEGGPLEVLCLFPDGAWKVARLGLALDAGERPQLVIPAGTWFGTELARTATHCLIGCTVAPGFELADFELASGSELEARYPDAAVRIRRMQGP